MNLLMEYSNELIKLSVVGLAVGGALVFLLAKGVDSGIFDDKKMQEYYKNKKGDVVK